MLGERVDQVDPILLEVAREGGDSAGLEAVSPRQDAQGNPGCLEAGSERLHHVGEAVDVGFARAPVQPPGQLEELPLGAAGVQLADHQGHADRGDHGRASSR